MSDFEADIPATLAAIFRPGNPAAQGQVYRSALVSRNGGWFGAARRAPVVPADPTLWPPADFAALVAAFQVTGFRPANAWYLNDAANVAYACTAADHGRLQVPMLFINGELDGLCDIRRNQLGDPMRQACSDLTVTSLSAGHWLPLERNTELIDAIRSWANAKELRAAKAASPFASWKVDHAGIRVPDFDQAIAWYTDVLDFRLRRSVTLGKLTFGFVSPATDDTFSIEILAGPGAAERPPYENFHASYDMSGWHHLGIRVDDVDATIAELKRRGVKIISEPHDVAVLSLRLAFFADPWGNLLEVTAPLSP